MFFIKSFRKKLHLNRVEYRDKSNMCIVHMPDGRTKYNPKYIKWVCIRFKGANSVIEIWLSHKLNGSVFILYNNDHFIINAGVAAEIFVIGSAGCSGGAVLNIGENSSLNNTKFYLNSCPGASISLGKDCMFSTDVTLWASDTHQITDCSSQLVINNRSGIIIGDHVWCGTRCTILKTTEILDNTVIGAASVVSGKFDVGNVILAGNPARVIKSGIDWKRDSLPDK